MRIALFSETYLPQINGVATHVSSLKEGLEQLGHEVLVVTADATARRHYITGGILHCPAYTAKRFYNYGLSLPLSSTRLKLVSQFRPDVIHVHNEFGIGISGVLIAKVLGVPLVYTLHTMYDEYIYYIAPRSLTPAATKLSHQYTKLFAKAAQALTGPSKKCEEYFQKAGVYKPVNVIPNPVELQNFRRDCVDDVKKQELRASLGYDENTTVAVFVGRLGREKSVHILLDYWKEAVCEQDNIRLLVIGDGPVRSELEEQAAQLDITDMVTFAGKIAHEELPPYLAACDLYITASTSDTNSISMLEGMACGLPVLQIVDPLNEGQVRDGINGFVFSTPHDLASKLRLIRNMPTQQLEQLRASTRASVERSGAVDLAQYVLNVYDQAIGNKNVKLHHFILRLRKTASLPFRMRKGKLHINRKGPHE